MNRGIIIHGEARKGRLSVFQLTDWPTMVVDHRMHTDALAALHAQGLAGVSWIAGTAASRKLAKRLGLKFRLRAPGGGRPKVAIEEKAKQVTIWMTPAQEANLKRIAELKNQAAGEWVANAAELALTCISE